MPFKFAESDTPAQIKVVGVGGAGGNAISRMMEDNLHGVNFIAVNTDRQALNNNPAPNKIQIGSNITRGLGAGSDPEIGKMAMEEDKDALNNMLSDTDMLFITCGMGGGTGTGASPVIANMAREHGILTVGIITKPFLFEGAKRMKNAENGIETLRDIVDTLIVIQNQRLLSIVDQKTSLTDAFKIADSILLQATRGISDLITIPGLINLDFADIRTIMREKGDAIMGIGSANGENKAVEAATQAISSPLLEDISIEGAEGLLINITGGNNLGLFEVNEAATVITDAVGNGANIILGSVIDDTMENEIRVTVIATGLNKGKKKPITLDEESNFFNFKHKREVEVSKETVEIEEKEDTEKIETILDFEKEELDKAAFAGDLDIPTFLRKQMD